MLTIAQLGHGRWGQNISRTLREDIGGVELHIAETAAASKKLQQEPVDAAVIATPGSTHADLALPFIERGIPTFIEKPLTTSLADAKRLAKAAAKHNASIFVGHIHLFNPAYQKAKQLIHKAGKIRTLQFEGMNNGPIRDDMSALWDWSPHDVAMALDLTGSMPVAVQAWGERILRPKTNLYDTVHLRLTFPNNVTTTIHNSWLSPQKRKKATISCTRDTIVYDDTGKRKVTLHKKIGPTVRGKRAQENSPKVSHPRYSEKSPLELELRLRAVRTGITPLTDITHALNVVRILDAAERSIELDGKLVKL